MPRTKVELEAHLECLRRARDYQKREEERDLAFGFLPKFLAIPFYVIAVLWFLIVGIAAQANIISIPEPLVTSELEIWLRVGAKVAILLSTVYLMCFGLEAIDQSRKERRKNYHHTQRKSFDQAILDVEHKLEGFDTKNG